MKRSEMVLRLAETLIEVQHDDVFEEADYILKHLERAGMRPPPVDEESCQALMTVYYAGYTFNQWDEDLEKDVKVMEAKKKRAERRKKGD